MKQIFAVISDVRNWIKGVLTDPNVRLYSSTTLVAMGIIAAKQMKVPVTITELMRITGMSSMQIYRGTNTLSNHGFLERDSNGVWNWIVKVPNDIANLHPNTPNGSGVEELKAFITEAISNITDTPDGPAATELKRVVKEVEKFDPKRTRNPRAESGPKALFGDAVLDVEDKDDKPDS